MKWLSADQVEKGVENDYLVICHGGWRIATWGEDSGGNEDWYDTYSDEHLTGVTYFMELPDQPEEEEHNIAN